MLDEPPEKTIESITVTLLFCESKAALRGYAGPRKKRKVAVCREIATRIAPRYMFPVEFRDGDRLVTAQELTDVLADVLRSIPDDKALLMAAGNNRQQNGIARMIARRAAKRLKSAFQMRQIDNRAAMLRANNPEQKPYGDEALDNLHRLGSLIPRYRWKRTADAYTPDFTGYDADLPFARVWFDNSKVSQEWWQWECTVKLNGRLNSPPSGGADITRQAARDAEDYYDALKRHNRLIG